MIRRTILRSFVALSAVLALAGCAGSPIIGKWSRTQGTGTVTQKFTITFNAGGTVDAQITGSGDCTGTMSVTGARWTATDTTVTTTGTSTCTGSITCMAAGQSITIDCSMANAQPTGMPQTYSVSGNTLTLAGDAYTRE